MIQIDLEDYITHRTIQDFYKFDKRIELSFSGDTATMTKGNYSFEFSTLQWVEWREGKLIQDAFPSLGVDEREMLMTGITPFEWDAMFNEE